MAQFASTLYPQTNPTNPLLHDFRVFNEIADMNPGLLRDTPLEWLEYAERSYPLWSRLERCQLAHARRVLTRLASFSG